MDRQELFDRLDQLSVEDLLKKENQQAIFGQMLQSLEYLGKCHYVYHRLAAALWGDPMENGEVTDDSPVAPQSPS